jgi:hypothetical protein
MASSVLGKRTRSSIDAGMSNLDILRTHLLNRIAGPNSATLRAKRQATITVFNDDKENLSAPRQTRANVRDVASMGLDELADIPAIKIASAEHGKAGGRVALSPTKIKTHSNTASIGSSELPTERIR